MPEDTIEFSNKSFLYSGATEGEKETIYRDGFTRQEESF